MHLLRRLLSLSLFTFISVTVVAQDYTVAPQQLVARVFGMVAAQTDFKLRYHESQEPQERTFLFDPRRAGGHAEGALEMAITFSTDKQNMRLGFAGDGAMFEVFIDGERLSVNSVDGGGPVRKDYSFAVFPTTINMPDRYADGRKHTLELRNLVFDPEVASPGLYLSWLLPNGMGHRVSTGQEIDGKQVGYKWRTPGGAWQAPTLPAIPESGERLDWSDFRYFTGTILAALRDAEAYYREPRYGDYVQRHHDFFFANRGEVARSREENGFRGGLFGHYFRFLMLDDFGPQGVTLAESAAARAPFPNHPLANEGYQLANAIAHQILTAVPRLEDGTLCRITPDSFTVQSDDLFMANLFSVRAGLALGREDLLEDALLQSVNFSKYLTDEKTGLYRHAYNTKSGQQSSTIWGRGMGWTMVVDAILLERLAGRDDPRMEQILKSFQSRCAALLDYQSADGRWHQVITDSTTYKETSCTAMFTYALATGYRMGWLTGEKYRDAALLGYRGMSGQISTDGTIAGIVQGTPILPNPAAYDNHATRKNDPRGVGAILWAAMAIDKLANEKGW
ncbi:glycoside hydrolase family 88/105 protein [Neolewinella antarctica]|uniref:Rhamnogalacturonyl hydrolase YesR n=1 Tax=Neolewinella antarctica TaxID=442734 RepID=A0ABX0X7H2_9BACT|nr:glycoside hydrolase family 88 protein [Neolewinella antarctica]NJC24934.1 rhamnogalacturonyl hydrolase YesR [Neolewinella antarctica]